jgi:hypothetical protein
MTRTLSLILLCLGAVPAGAQDTCPWAGGEYGRLEILAADAFETSALSNYG